MKWKEIQSAYNDMIESEKSSEQIIQELRRKVKLLEAKNAELEHVHQLDMAAIAYQRRQIDFLMDAERGEDDG